MVAGSIESLDAESCLLGMTIFSRPRSPSWTVSDLSSCAISGAIGLAHLRILRVQR